MAGDIAGMFSQINSAMGQNPLGGEMGGNLMNQLSQQVGGAMGAATGRDPMEFQSPEAKKLEAQKQIAKLDLSTSEGLKQAAQLYQQSGDVDKSLMAIEKAKQIEEAENAKNKAILDAGNEGIQAEAARKKEHSQKVQAILLAKRDGDETTVAALQSGALSPEAFFQKKMEDKKLYELSKGEMLTDKDGNVIRINPDTNTVTGGDLSVHDKKQWDTLSTASYENDAYARKLESLSEQIQATTWESGAYATAEDAILTLLGKRDDPQYLRTKVNSVRNHEGIAMLPKGPASDKDIALVMQGVPPANAGKEEIVQFVQAQSRVAKRLAEYDKMRARYVIEGRRSSFQRDWESLMNAETRKEKIQATPPEAIAWYKSNPSTENRDAFYEKYGYYPDE